MKRDESKGIRRGIIGYKNTDINKSNESILATVIDYGFNINMMTEQMEFLLQSVNQKYDDLIHKNIQNYETSLGTRQHHIQYTGRD